MGIVATGRNRVRLFGLLLLWCVAGAVGAAGTEGDEEEISPRAEYLAWIPDLPRQEPRRQQRWVTDWGKAVLEARARRTGILVVLATDDTPGLWTAFDRVLSSSTFREIGERWVTMPAVGGDNGATHWKEDADGHKVLWCDRFDLPVEERRALFDRLFPRFVLAEFWQPLYLFLDSDGEEIARLQGHEIPIRRLVDEVEHAQAEIGEAIPWKKYQRWNSELRAVVEARANTPAAMFAELEAAAPQWASDGMRSCVDRLRRAVEASAERRIWRLLDLGLAGDRAQAISTLEAMLEEFQDTEVAASVADALKRLR